jgi:hypothetical protein
VPIADIWLPSPDHRSRTLAITELLGDGLCPKTALVGHVLAAAPAAVQEAIHFGNKPHHLKPGFL